MFFPVQQRGLLNAHGCPMTNFYPPCNVQILGMKTSMAKLVTHKNFHHINAGPQTLGFSKQVLRRSKDLKETRTMCNLTKGRVTTIELPSM